MSGCSTGERSLQHLPLCCLRVTLKTIYYNCTDIDTRVLETARSGIYPIEVVQTLDISLLKKYFLKGKDQYDGYAKVKNFLKEKISFQSSEFA